MKVSQAVPASVPGDAACLSAVAEQTIGAAELRGEIRNLDRQIEETEAQIRRASISLQSLVAMRAEHVSALERALLQEEINTRGFSRPQVVLIVQPDEISRRFLGNVVDRADHIPVLVPSASAAVKSLTESPADLVVADIEMGDMEADQFLHIIREDLGKIHLPIVLLTHAQDRRHVVAVASHRVQGHLVKPVRREHLITMINDLTVAA